MTDTSSHPVTAKAVEVVLDIHPTLNEAGYGRPDFGDGFDPDQARANLREQIEQIQIAYDYLSELRRSNVSEESPSSYTLKHLAEQAANRYITNGALIVAAHILGLQVMNAPGDLNADVGVRLRVPVIEDAEVGTFNAWLWGHREARNPIGDLARDVASDDCWPADGDYPTLRDHIRGHSSWDAPVETLREAWTLYSGKPPVETDEDE